MRDGLPEGKGVFATEDMPKGTIVCNYGGKFHSHKYCEKNLLPFEQKCDYLIELRENMKGKWALVYLNHDSTTDSFGKFLNHSQKHPNLKTKIFALGECAKLDILFITKRTIKKNEELVWDYGPKYTGVGKCVSSCRICKK